MLTEGQAYAGAPHGGIKGDVADEEGAVALDGRDVVEEGEVGMGEDDAAQGGDVPGHSQTGPRQRRRTDLMTIESSISSAPALAFAANTGGTDRTTAALTTWK